MFKQIGIALITAMLIAALVTAGAVALATNQYFGTRLVSNTQSADRADLAIDELEVLAIQTLMKDSKRGQYDAMSEAWAAAEFSATRGDVTAIGELRDLQGSFNLTNLSPEPLIQGQADDSSSKQPAAPASSTTPESSTDDLAPPPPACAAGTECPTTPVATESVAPSAARPPAIAGPAANDPAQTPPSEQQIRLLFKALALDESPVQAILDWVDPDTETRFPNGAEDDYYTEQSPAYRAANRPFATPRELLLVRGIKMETYQKLAPFVVCLPQASKVNVNTARKEVLMSLSVGIDGSAAETIIRARDAQPFTSPEFFLKHPLIVFRQVSTDAVVTASDYFELHSIARNGRFDISTSSVLKRTGGEVARIARKRQNFDE